MRQFPRISLTALCMILAGCAALGPTTVNRDRFDYTAAIADSWKRQMLLNIVKIRYGDAPIFLDVASVINQYEVQTNLSASFGWLSLPSSNSQNVTAGGHYIDRPTITYTPMTGEKFARNLMTPVAPATVMSMVEGGYPIDLVFRLVVHTINGIDNRFGGAARRKPADPEFYELLARLRRIQNSGAIGLRVQRVGRDEATLLTLRQKVEPSIAADILMVRQLLGLDPQGGEFRVVYGAVAANDKELAMLTRSILDILVDMASFITVPEAHVQEKRVLPTADPETGPGGPIPPLVRIQSSPEKPGDAFVMVPYRGHWYWIDDRDIPSKTLFSFLMFLFTLVETGDKGAPPVVTIPAG